MSCVSFGVVIGFLKPYEYVRSTIEVGDVVVHIASVYVIF